jgi:DNA-binding protein H-NS
MAKVGGVDLSNLSIQELQELAREIENEIVTRREQDRERVLQQMRELAASVGMTLEDFLRQERGRGRAAVPAGGVAVKYRHPDDPGLTWSGRGKRPNWVNDALDSGKTLDDLAVDTGDE